MIPPMKKDGAPDPTFPVLERWILGRRLQEHAARHDARDAQ
jgi:hypothetical protein